MYTLNMELFETFIKGISFKKCKLEKGNMIIKWVLQISYLGHGNCGSENYSVKYRLD